MARLKIYTDENVDVRVVQGVRRRGIEVTSALEEGKIEGVKRDRLIFGPEWVI